MVLRICFVMVWFYLAIVVNNIWFMGTLNTVSVLVLYLQIKNLTIIMRSLRLLMWLLIPTTVLHAFFTPGTYITAPFYLPISIEGLERALFLSLKITSIFFAALLVSKLLTMGELLLCFGKVPKLHALTHPYLLLLPKLRRMIQRDIPEQKMDWKKSGGKWLSLPDVLAAGIISMVQKSKNEANDLWQQWETKTTMISEQKHTFYRLKHRDFWFGTLALVALVIYG